MNCRQCNGHYQPWRERQKFCSHNCADESRRKTDINRLCQLAYSGATKAEMAREFGVGYSTVRRWITEYGLETTWREQRYA